MPEETPQQPAVVNLNNPQQKKIELSKTKFWLLIGGFVALLIAGIIGSYVLGQQTAKNNQPVVAKKETKTEDQTKKEADIKTIGMDEEVTVKSGITLVLTDAKIDQVYEQQKKEQKTFYEKYSSDSAYLKSDYFTSSNLIVKVSLTNGGKVATSYNPSSFRLKDSKDNQYSYGGVAEGEKTPIYSLNPGETTKLSLSFTIPETEKKFSLIYENAVIKFQI